MNGKPSISIVITGYNSAQYLTGCLDSINRQTFRDFEIIFINNGSTDNTQEVLRSYPLVKVIDNNVNRGFCFANNQGIKMARGRYLVTLNSDVVLDSRFLEELKKAADSSDAALYGAKILNKDGRLIDSTGLVLSGSYRFFDRGANEVDSGQYDKELDIFGPCAAAALYKREMLEDIRYNGEYFDNDFFFLGEDFDLSWRARNRGWKALFVPSAICYHDRNSTGFNVRLRQYLSFRNRAFLLIKNSSLGRGYLISLIFYDIPRTIYMLLTNKYTLRALYEIIKFTPEMRKRRKNVKKA